MQAHNVPGCFCASDISLAGLLSVLTYLIDEVLYEHHLLSFGYSDIEIMNTNYNHSSSLLDIYTTIYVIDDRDR